MHRLILPAAFVLLLSACSTYQYMTVDSQQLKKNDKSQLVLETDTLRLVYNFNGKGGIVSVNIYNKTGQPMYIDWKKSAFIRNEVTTPFFDNNITLLNSRADLLAYRNHTTLSEGRYNGSLSIPESTQFIPPASSVTKILPDLVRTGQLETDRLDSLQQKPLAENGATYSHYRQLSFSEDQSPVRFKSYITFYLGDSSARTFAETCSFYIGEICQTSSAPDFFTLYKQQGDQFYITKSSDTR